MNRLVIIGNGFDMAHGLKTSYMDFINWYWDRRVDNINLSSGITSVQYRILRYDKNLHQVIPKTRENAKIIRKEGCRNRFFSLVLLLPLVSLF